MTTEEEFTEIYLKYKGYVYKGLLKWGLKGEDLEDCAQEFWRRLVQTDAPARFKEGHGRDFEGFIAVYISTSTRGIAEYFYEVRNRTKSISLEEIYLDPPIKDLALKALTDREEIRQIREFNPELFDILVDLWISGEHYSYENLGKRLGVGKAAASDKIKPLYEYASKVTGRKIRKEQTRPFGKQDT